MSKEKYCSTQFNLPQIGIKAFAKEIPDSDIYDKEENTGREKEPHVTVLFRIKNNDPKKVKKLVRKNNIDPIKITLGQTSVFENEKFDVLKVDVKSPQLRKLRKLFEKNLPNDKKFDEYRPHVTIAYLKPGKGKKWEGDKRFKGKEITLSTLLFSNPDRIKTKIDLTMRSKEAKLSDDEIDKILLDEKDKKKMGLGGAALALLSAGKFGGSRKKIKSTLSVANKANDAAKKSLEKDASVSQHWVGNRDGNFIPFKKWVNDKDHLKEIKDEALKDRENNMTKKAEEAAESLKEKAKAVAALPAAGVGVHQAFKTYQKGELDGREKLWHSTALKNVDSIKEEGIKPPKDVKNSFTGKILSDMDPKKLKNKVYLGKNPITAKGVGINKSLTDGSSPKNLKVSVPYGSLNKTKNPELRGASNRLEFAKKIQKANKDVPGAFMQGLLGYGEVSDKGTATVKGKVPSKRIKNSDDYVKNSLKEVSNHVKKNPKAFAKGVGRAGLATGLIGFGAHTINKNIKK